MTARFFEYINGDWVKISIKPGQSLSWYSRERTEEGWSAEGVTWEYTTDDNDMPCIVRDAVDEGRDCDGKHADYRVDSCLLENLKARQREDCPNTPLWEKVSTRAYDEYAERAGY